MAKELGFLRSTPKSSVNPVGFTSPTDICVTAAVGFCTFSAAQPVANQQSDATRVARNALRTAVDIPPLIPRRLTLRDVESSPRRAQSPARVENQACPAS